MIKRTLLVLCISVLSSSCFAQDLIYLKDNTIIKSEVKQATLEFVKYVKYNDLDDAEYTIASSNILKIVFSNGYIREYSKEIIAKPEVKSERDNYFALAAGVGRSYGGLGICAQARFGKKQGFGLHGGVGYNPSDAGGICFGVGAKFFYYRWLYINAQAGIVSHNYIYEYNYFDDNIDSSDPLFGFSILIGGDFIFGKHAGFNLALGPTITDDGTKLGADLGFVIKF